MRFNNNWRLATKPYSPELWRTYRTASVDLQRQVGWPSLFITIAPCEWAFPYHQWLQDELRNSQQIQASATALAAGLADGSAVTWGDARYGAIAVTCKRGRRMGRRFNPQVELADGSPLPTWT